jgi:hypothetical protein
MITAKCVNDTLKSPTRERPFQVALRMFAAFEYLAGQRNLPERRVDLKPCSRNVAPLRWLRR